MSYNTINYEIPDYGEIYNNVKEALEASEKTYVAFDRKEYPLLADKRVRTELMTRGIIITLVKRNPVVLARFNTD